MRPRGRPELPPGAARDQKLDVRFRGEEVEVMKELRHKKEEEAGVERMAMASERRY